MATYMDPVVIITIKQIKIQNCGKVEKLLILTQAHGGGRKLIDKRNPDKGSELNVSTVIQISSLHRLLALSKFPRVTSNSSLVSNSQTVGRATKK